VKKRAEKLVLKMEWSIYFGGWPSSESIDREIGVDKLGQKKGPLWKQKAV
jgi:hypothetical protein